MRKCDLFANQRRSNKNTLTTYTKQLISHYYGINKKIRKKIICSLRLIK